jgi:hypothetical protein
MRYVLTDESEDLFNERGGCRGRNHSCDSAGLDQGQEDQTPEAHSRRCQGEKGLDHFRYGQTPLYEGTNLLDGWGEASQEELSKRDAPVF